MPQNQPVEGSKSMPCIEKSPKLVESDHSLTSYKSFNTEVENGDTSKAVEDHSTVKALIKKHTSFQENLINSKITNFNIKKKSFANACEKLNKAYNDCINMEGDSNRVDNVEEFVKNHVYQVFTANTYMEKQMKPPLLIDQKLTRNVQFDFKTGVPDLDEAMNEMGRRLWEKVISMIDLNHDYFECLTYIMNMQKVQTLEEVMVNVSETLKKGQTFELIGSELLASGEEFTKKIGIILNNNKVSYELAKKSYLSTLNELVVLKNELAENKRNTKIAENQIAVLRKEKKDLLSILDSYDSENIHKVSLEKRLKAEQETNEKLREMVAVAYKKKLPLFE